MERIRYVKSAEELAKAAAADEFSPVAEVIEAVYETDAEIAAAVLPPPLEPAERPLVRVSVSRVELGAAGNIGACIFGVDCKYKGAAGHYPITMPMSTEPVVIGGRERFGEPKKLAEIDFERTDGSIVATVARYGRTYIELRGQVTESLEPVRHIQDNYYYKVFPAADGKGFEGEPLLVRVRYDWEQPKIERMQGEGILTEAPLDPVGDLPVRRLVSMHYYQREGGYSAEVVERLNPRDIAPYVHQRYDDFSALMG